VSFQRPQITYCFEVFEKLTRACFIQIALETMLLPFLYEKYNVVNHRDRAQNKLEENLTNDLVEKLTNTDK
jgi:hypothetical protein